MLKEKERELSIARMADALSEKNAAHRPRKRSVSQDQVNADVIQAQKAIAREVSVSPVLPTERESRAKSPEASGIADGSPIEVAEQGARLSHEGSKSFDSPGHAAVGGLESRPALMRSSSADDAGGADGRQRKHSSEHIVDILALSSNSKLVKGLPNDTQAADESFSGSPPPKKATTGIPGGRAIPKRAVPAKQTEVPTALDAAPTRRSRTEGLSASGGSNAIVDNSDVASETSAAKQRLGDGPVTRSRASGIPVPSSRSSAQAGGDAGAGTLSSRAQEALLKHQVNHVTPKLYFLN